MIGRHAPFRRYVAEHGVLLKIVSSHWAAPHKSFLDALKTFSRDVRFLFPPSIRDGFFSNLLRIREEVLWHRR
jgi:hypothetical protein